MTLIGISFPFAKGYSEFPMKSYDSDVLEDNIRRIVMTRPGERVMRDVGSGAWAFVFDNTGPVMRAKVRSEVRRALMDGEPRVTVLNVYVTEMDVEDGTLVDVTIEWKPRDALLASPTTTTVTLPGGV
jgi:phage baseplate assembly protein W